MRHACALFLKAVVILAVYAVCYAGDEFGFDSQQGFIPNDCPGCRVQVDIPDPLEDGMIIELNDAATAECGETREWRVAEFAPGKFFAAAVIPLPDPLLLNWEERRNHPFNYGRLKDEDECTALPLERAPIEDAHEVLKTEDCERALYDAYAEEVTYRGFIAGVNSHRVNRRVLSEFKRWLVTVDDPDAVLGYTLIVVEEFAPDHGNARWHSQRYDDVTPYSCPPGDWRDILPLEQEAFDTYPIEEAHRRAAHLDYNGNLPRKGEGMVVTPTNGATRTQVYSSGRTREIMDFATGDQIHGVVPLGRFRCVATARMILSDDPEDEDVKALARRMSEDDMIWVNYSPIWRRSPVWYRREETSREIPDDPNYVFQETKGVSYRDPEQPDETVSVPSGCPAPPAPSPPRRRPARTRSR